MTPTFWGIGILAALLSSVSPFVWRPILASAEIIDVPNGRSSHSKPTLRGGGLAPLTALFIVGLLVIYLSKGDIRGLVTAVLAAAIMTSLVGLKDDISGLSMVARAAAQIAIGVILAVALSAIFDRNWLLIPIAAIVFAANVNFTNFMDGINGVSSLHGLVVGLAFAGIGAFEGHLWLSILGLLLAAVFIAFLPWNLLPPGMFLGDAGSYLLGGMTGALMLATIWAGVNPIVAIAPLTIYWVDAVSTLGKRFIKGEPIFKAHRTHIYQQLTDRGFSHIEVAGIVALFTAAASLIVLVFPSEGALENLAKLAALSIIYFFYLALPNLTKKKETALS